MGVLSHALGTAIVSGFRSQSPKLRVTVIVAQEAVDESGVETAGLKVGVGQDLLVKGN